MNDFSRTRRDFLLMGAQAAGVSMAAVSLPAILATAAAAARSAEDGDPYGYLSPAEVRVLTAVSDQVFPPDEQAGASALGAVRFMDHALGGFMAGALALVQAGCAELDQAALVRHGAAFSQLAFDDQTALLEQRVSTPFFATLHFLTIAGVFSAPAYGGNRDGQGWKMLGFEPRHAWQPPFGHYDALYSGEGGDGPG